MEQNIRAFVEGEGVEKIGFMTLTFPEDVDRVEAMRRLNSFVTGWLRARVGEYVRVFERTLSGRPHYHFLIDMKQDIRTGFDFDAVSARDYRSANPFLRGWWADLRSACSRYGIGRSEILPIRTTAEGVAKYLVKYLSKFARFRRIKDRRVRMVAYSSGFPRVARHGFAWVSSAGREFRRKLRLFAAHQGIRDLDGMKKRFGPRWAYCLANVIASIDLPPDAASGMLPPSSKPAG